MKKSHKLLLTALIAAAGFAANAQAQTKDIVVDTKTGTVPYLIDSRGVLARSGTGLCWRTGYWSKELAQQVQARVAGESQSFPVGCYCDKELMPQGACEAPKAPVAAPAPVAPAAPVAPVATPSDVKLTIPADALFAFDKADLTPEGRDRLTAFVGAINQKLKSLEVVIAVGHADRIGSDAYNQRLSERRAATVKNFLVSQGIEANRVYTEGKGESQPVTGDSCKRMGAENRHNKKLIDCLAPDRRVELEAVGLQK